MNAQQLVVTAVIGIVAGFLASILVGSPRFGLIGLLIAGLLGSIVGSFVLKALGVRIGVGNPLADNIIVSAIGAVIVIMLARLLG